MGTICTGFSRRKNAFFPVPWVRHEILEIRNNAISRQQAFYLEIGSELWQSSGMMVDPKHVTSKSQFLGFLEGLQADLKVNPEGWENPTLDRYLEAMAAWVAGCENYYRNTGEAAPVEPNWAFFAEVLAAARIYE